MRTSKMLIVEDDIPMSELYEFHLKRSNLDVIYDIAHNSSKALELSRETEYDLVVMDILLQDSMDGAELAEAITDSSKWYDHIPVIFISASNESKRILHNRYPTASMINKNGSIETLMVEIEKMLLLSRSLRIALQTRTSVSASKDAVQLIIDNNNGVRSAELRKRTLLRTG